MIGLIGGTGLGEALFGEAHAEEHRMDTPFGQPSSPVRVVSWHGVRVALIARHGQGHIYNPSQVPYRANIYALKALGCTHVIASGAVGSLREHIHPRQLVIPDQIIDKTHRRIPTFFDAGLAVHVEMANPYCGNLRRTLLSLAPRVDTVVHARGTYVCMEGPAFSTIAESNMHRFWGGDLIGMTAMPEAKLAREAEMCYAMIALPTDYDCWRPHSPGANKQKLLEEIIGHLRAATANAVALMKAAIEHFSTSPPTTCECHDSLSLAIWSDGWAASRVSDRYGVLLRKYVS